MEYLNWGLFVLSRAVAYPNLTTAAAHVGLSQPQLSRVVQRLEKEFQVQLLEREAKRKSSWAHAAHRLAEIYLRTDKDFQSAVFRISQGLEITHLRLGILEGLAPAALQFAHYCFEGQHKNKNLKILEIDVHDLNELEELFLKRGFDFVFSSREPGKKKQPYVKILGYQNLEKVSSKGDSYRILSSYQFGRQVSLRQWKTGERWIVSNSLDVRRKWQEAFGGQGTFPSSIKKKAEPGAQSQPVLMIGHHELPSAFWRYSAQFTL